MQNREIISGVNVILEVLRSGRRRCYEISIAEGKKESILHEVEMLARKKGIPCRFVPRSMLTELSRIEKHQGIIAKVDPFEYIPFEQLLADSVAGRDSLLLILDSVLDPQNLGSLIRTAHLLGVDGLIFPKNNAAAVGPAATRASAGATEYLPIAQVTNLTTVLKQLKSKGYWIYGAEGVGSRSIYDIDLSTGHMVLVMGGEGTGMRRLVREGCDELLSIPMAGKIGSFNVSVAGGILLSEIIRQRKTSVSP